MTNHPNKSPKQTSTGTAALPTFMDHVRELQGRLFIVALTFVGISAAAYPFFDKIAAVILSPLGKEQELVYLTPGGAFSFIIKVCLYVGVIGVLPLIIYHLYRFVMPAVKKVSLRRVLGYTFASLVLAICGILFAYFVSLPAALYFLTGFDLYHINPMITIDSYFSFVMTYILAGAILFQIPLIMKIIDSATPLKPSRLMGFQRHIIVGSFVVAALISPTPDAMNQTILASPMVGMYQVGVIAVWSGARTRNKKDETEDLMVEGEVSQEAQPNEIFQAKEAATIQKDSGTTYAVDNTQSDITHSTKVSPAVPAEVRPTTVRSIDGFYRQRASAQLPLSPARGVLSSQGRQIERPVIRTSRSIDGIVASR